MNLSEFKLFISLLIKDTFAVTAGVIFFVSAGLSFYTNGYYNFSFSTLSLMALIFSCYRVWLKEHQNHHETVPNIFSPKIVLPTEIQPKPSLLWNIEELFWPSFNSFSDENAEDICISITNDGPITVEDCQIKLHNFYLSEPIKITPGDTKTIKISFISYQVPNWIQTQNFKFEDGIWKKYKGPIIKLGEKESLSLVAHNVAKKSAEFECVKSGDSWKLQNISYKNPTSSPET